MKYSLLPHNQSAYENVMEAFKTKQRVAVVHATGTGKSYIIAAVANEFNRVCIIAPNKFVLEETQKVCKPGVDFITYSGVLAKKGLVGSYDLIVLDEFHRSGADKWGSAVKTFIENNSTAKVLGASATNIRYLDKMRDMAAEIFYGNIVSYLTLNDAMARGILPKPTYVTALYSIEQNVNSLRFSINNSHLNDKSKKTLVNKLTNISQKWEKSNGVSEIIKKYISKDTKRILVFCSSVNESRKTMQLISNWFYAAGFRNTSIFSVDYSSDNLNEVMRNFYVDDNKLKIAVSINMLNEGVHVPDVDAVIMLRTTSSRVIVEQQMGRCLNAGEPYKKPVVLDLCNNINLVTKLPFVFFQEGDGDPRERDRNKQDFEFSIIDESKDIQAIFDDFSQEIAGVSWEEQKALLQEFYDKFGHLPTNQERPLQHRWWYLVLKNGEPSQKMWVIERGGSISYNKVKAAYNMKTDEMLDALDRIGNKYGSISRRAIPNEEDRKLVEYARRQLESLPVDSEEYQRFQNMKREFSSLKDAQYWLNKAVQTFVENGKLDTLTLLRIREFRKVGMWPEEYDNKLQEVGYVHKFDKDRQSLEELVALVEREGRLPNEETYGTVTYQKARLFFGTTKRSDAIRKRYPDLYERMLPYAPAPSTKRMSIDECYSKISTFVKKYTCFPKKRDENGKYTPEYLAYRAVVRDIEKHGKDTYDKHKSLFDNFILISEKYMKYNELYYKLVEYKKAS